ncbi:MAG: PAS domain S-box protein [Deltaproteobacteria bacterium]|nr:PAS domain S-box protein [Deltaproteobacteria bacterium]
MKDERKNGQPSILAEMGMERDDFYRNLFENANDGLAIVKLDHTIVHLNRSMERLLGWSRKELIGKSDHTVLTPAGIASAQKREQQLRNGEKIPSTFEHEFLRKDGSTIWVEGRTRFIKAQDGTLIGFQGIYRDISERKAAEAALQESEKKYRGLYESIADGIVRSGEDDRIVECNQTFANLVGYSLQELKGRHCNDLTPERWHAVEDEIVATQVLPRGYSDEYEKEFIRKDGTLLPVAMKLWMMKDAHGEKQALWGIVRDIGERKAAQEAVQQSQQRYRTLVHSIDGIVWEADAVTFQFTFVSPQAEQLLGYPVEQWLSEPDFWSNHIHPEDRERTVSFCRAEVEQQRSHRCDYRMLTSDGRVIWLHDRINVIVENGRVTTLCGVMTDISERKQAEALLQAGRDFALQVMTAMGQGLVVTNAESVIEYINPAVTRIFGYRSEEVIGKSSFSFGAPEDQALIRQEFSRRHRGEISTYETRVLHVDGHYLSVLITSSPRWRDSTMIGAILIISDLTGRKQVEEERRHWEAQLIQAQKMEALGLLAGGVAHGFNNILTAMLGYSELIEDDLPEKSTAHRNLIEIIHAGRRAQDLVQQLLTFSRPSQGGKRWIRLQSIVEETLSLLHASLPKTVTLQQDLACPTETILADPAQIQQMVLNLGMNGAQAMGKRPGPLTVELRRIEGENAGSHMASARSSGPSLRLSVRDTGRGIEPEILPRIFDPFFTTKPIGEGTGLGLAIVHAVVTAHGGTVTVDSQLNCGTTFYVDFPLKPTADPRETAILRAIKEVV